jgi:hypothetical protein
MNGALQNSPIIRENYRKFTYRQQSGRYTPQRFGQQSWYRFLENRAAIYVDEVGGEPSQRQSRLIEQMVNAEWQALKLERQAENIEDARDLLRFVDAAAEWRRQLLLLDRELAATMRRAAASTATPGKGRPGPNQATLDEQLALLRRREPGE